MNYLQKKKLAFMSIVNRVKGFIRTITGALPLTLEGCVDEESIIDYTLYGQCVQDGTPTPESPVEIQSVGDLTTKNLFNYADYTTLTSYNGNDISANWLTIDGDLFYIKYDYYNGGCWLTPTKQWELSSGTYTLSGKCKDNTIKGNPNPCYCGVRWSDDTRNAGWGKINSNDGEWYSFSYTFTITEDKTVKGIYLQDNGGTAKSSICFTNIQLEEGSTATEYEPYHKYDIPVVTKGKNLLPYPYYNTTKTLYGVTWTDNGDGTITASGTPTGNTSFFLTNRMSISTNTKYCFSGIDGTSNIMLNVTLYDENNTFVADLSNTNTSNSLAFDTTDYPSAIYARFLIKRKKNGVEVSGTIKPQLEPGSTATEYEPYKGSMTTHIYLDAPLRKVGDVADYIDFQNQKAIRQVEVLDDTGTKTISESLGVLAIPTEEIISLPTLKTYKGTNVITTETPIQPSNAEITYYSSLKE